MNSHRIHVSDVPSVEEAFLSYSSVSGWIAGDRGQQFVDLLRDCGRTRAFGDFWSYMLVAEGTVDVATEPVLALHDMAAIDIIVRQAGGRFTSINGTPGPYGPGALATNGLLHEEVLDILAPDEDPEDSLIITRRAG
jgi:histidinol-phosphatase